MADDTHHHRGRAISLGALATAAVLAAIPAAAFSAPLGTLRLSDMPPGWERLPSTPWTEGVCGFHFAPPVRADFMGPRAVPLVSAGARTFRSAPAAHRNLAFNLTAARACTAEGATLRVIAFPRTGDESFAMRLRPTDSSSGGGTIVFFRRRERIGSVSVVGHGGSSSFVVAVARKALRRLG